MYPILLPLVSGSRLLVPSLVPDSEGKEEHQKEQDESLLEALPEVSKSSKLAQFETIKSS